MKIRKKKFEKISPLEFLLLREELGLKRFTKTRKRDPEKREILLQLALKKIEEKEKNDFQLIGERRRKLKI
jgi:hypothetical protein